MTCRPSLNSFGESSGGGRGGFKEECHDDHAARFPIPGSAFRVGALGVARLQPGRVRRRDRPDWRGGTVSGGKHDGKSATVMLTGCGDAAVTLDGQTDTVTLDRCAPTL
jgi:hypothetical protein